MKIEFREATMEDANLYYQWANDEAVRKNSYAQEVISYEDHLAWFKRKIASPDCYFYLFLKEKNPAGQVRIEKKENETVVGISIDSKYRSKGLGSVMLELACADYFAKFPKETIYAYIKESNVPSSAIFKKANFTNEQAVMVSGVKSIKLHKTQQQ